MTFSLHEANYVVLDAGTHNTKVIKGLVDLVNQLPILVYSAQVLYNVPSTVNESTSATTQEQQTSTVKTDHNYFQPDGPQNSVLTGVPSTSNVQPTTNTELNILPVAQSTPAGQPKSEYFPRTQDAQWSAFVCGKDALNADQGGLDQRRAIRYPMKRGEIEDWEALEALWRHIIFGELALRPSRNESPVIVTVPVRWPREHYERISQMLFEEFNVPGIYFAEQPLMALYGVGTGSGLVVDVGAGTTDITPVIDGLVQYPATQTVDLAGDDLDVYFSSVLAEDPITVSELGETPNVEFARFVKESGICRVLEDPDALFPSPKESGIGTEMQAERESQNPIDSGSSADRGPRNSSGFSSVAEKVKETGNAAKKRIPLQWKGKKVTIGAARYRVADPLFKPHLLNAECLSLPEAIHTAIMACEPEKRPTCMGNVVLTGGISALPGLCERLQKELHRFLAISESSSEMQGTAARFLYVPEYFAALKDKTEYAAFLGAEIAGKHVFADGKFYIAKSDYNEHGPAATWIGREEGKR